jgi:pimeloyl-ACP methyl ester carboxylesterase
MSFATIDGRKLEFRLLPAAAAREPPLVFLHEGLGSIDLWRDFPEQVVARLGTPAMIYSRLGYGRSGPLPAPRTPRFMHEEALDVLPPLLDRLALRQPLLIGHSDGASIALIFAAAAARPVAGLVLMAPHVFVEEICVETIARARAAYLAGDLRSRLAKHHDHVDDAFLGWADTWLLPEFRTWSIEGLLQDIDVPMLLIQGANDEYGTLEQLTRIERRVKGPVTKLVLPDCGHSPHRDQPAAVLGAISDFVGSLPSMRDGEAASHS